MIIHIHKSKYSLAYVVTSILWTNNNVVYGQFGNSKASKEDCGRYCHEDCSKYFNGDEFSPCVSAKFDCSCGFSSLPSFAIPFIVIFGLVVLLIMSCIVYRIYSVKCRSGQYRGRGPISVPITPSPTAMYNSPSNGVTESSRPLATGIYSTPISAVYNTGAAPGWNTNDTAVQLQPSLNPYFVAPVESATAPGSTEGSATINTNDTPPSYDTVYGKY